jgi:hypothetical protein
MPITLATGLHFSLPTKENTMSQALTRHFPAKDYQNSNSATGYSDVVDGALSQDTWVKSHIVVGTTAERVATQGQRGLLWHDSDLDALCVYNGASWVKFADGTAAD